MADNDANTFEIGDLVKIVDKSKLNGVSKDDLVDIYRGTIKVIEVRPKRNYPIRCVMIDHSSINENANDKSCVFHYDELEKCLPTLDLTGVFNG